MDVEIQDNSKEISAAIKAALLPPLVEGHPLQEEI